MKERNSPLLLLHLSQLSFFFFPFLGILVPLLIWKINKNTENIDDTAKSIINFQFTWILASILPILFALYGGKLLIAWKILLQTYIISYGVLYLYNFIIIGVNSVKCYQGKITRYFPAIPFFGKTIKLTEL